MEADVEKIKEFIMRCRRDEGIPMLRTKMADVHFKDKVLTVCWGGRGRFEGGWIRDVSPETMEFIEVGREDWVRFLEKYGTEPERTEAYSYGIYISPRVYGLRPPKLPRIVRK